MPHTKGPWKTSVISNVDENLCDLQNGQYEIWKANPRDGDGPICFMNGCPDHWSDYSRRKYIADAHLIASAPDLLQQLEVALDLADYLYNEMEGNQDDYVSAKFTEATSEIIETIKLARGKS